MAAVAGGLWTVTTLVHFIGFTASGVAASSIAAAWQASLANVGAGTLFAWLQAFGAVGWSLLFGPCGLILAAIGGGIAAIASIIDFWN